MVVDLRELLKKIFALKGIEVLDREPYDYIWVRHEEGLELVYLEENEDVDGDYVLSFARNTEQVHASKTIICIKECTQDARKMAEKFGIELLNRAEFARVLGELIIELYESNKLEELSILEEEDVEVEDFEELESEDEDVIPIFLEEVGDGEERIIKPAISPQDADRIAREYVHGFTQELVLLPYYVFDYSLEVLIEGTIQTKAVKGVLALNALNGKGEFWKRGYETVTRLDIEHRKMEPKIDFEEAKMIAEKSLEEEYSKEEEVKIEGENVTIIEKRKTRPKKGSVKTNFLGLYYLPVWIMSGKGGMIMINAVTGATMKGKVY